jgi:DinB superfamily
MRESASVQPVTRCQKCGYDWDRPPEHAVATIRAFPGSVSGLLLAKGIADASRQLRTRPAPAVWSPLEYIAHTGDAIDWYARRVKRVLTEHRPALDPFDWDAHTASQRYYERHLDNVLDQIRRDCARLTATLADLTATDWEREGTGSDGQPRSVVELIHRAAHEAEHHLQDIRAGLTDTR